MASQQEHLKNLLNKLQDTYELLNFEYYYDKTKNGNQSYTTQISEYIKNLDMKIHSCTAGVFKVCAFPKLIDFIIKQSWTCKIHSDECNSPILEHEFRTDNYYSSTFSYKKSCYDKNECIYFTVTLTYNNVINVQPESYKIVYIEHETCAPFSNVINTDTITVTNITDMIKWIKTHI